jgi:hypothetical protein
MTSMELLKVAERFYQDKAKADPHLRQGTREECIELAFIAGFSMGFMHGSASTVPTTVILSQDYEPVDPTRS